MSAHPIVVIGGGFGGVYTTKHLLKKGYRVVLISQSPHFTFTPLLHEVATGSLLTHDIAFEYESFFHSPLFEFVVGTVTHIDPKEKSVWMDQRYISYDTLVIATGSKTNERLIAGMEYAFELKAVEDAQRVKKAMIAKAQGPEKKVRITVIGGGPTGCELVFEIERLLLALKKRHPELKHTLRLVHSKKEIGAATHQDMQRYIDQRLVRAHIDVVREALAQEVTQTHVITNKGTFESDITIVAAGVRPNTEAFLNVLPTNPSGHLIVESTLQVQGVSHVYALGDVICFQDAMLPKLAQTAVPQAQIVADNIVRAACKQPLRSYRVQIKGFLLSLGYGDGVGDIFGVVVNGPFAWYIWRTIYLFKTPGLTNKLRVAFSWTIGLFTGRNLTSL